MRRAHVGITGDLFVENLLVRDGRLSAVLDFGGLGIGDPTIDLIVAWEVLDDDARKVFREQPGSTNRRGYVPGHGRCRSR